jgi:tyrosine-protein kinase Etk/Wzc
LTQPHQSRPDGPDIDLPTLGRALWRAKRTILGLAIGAGVLTYVVLLMMRPLYTSEARILIQNEESAFNQPANSQVRDVQQRTLDEQAIQSQVQVLTSRDLADAVIKDLDLVNNADFAEDAGTGLVARLLKSLGLARGSAESEQEKAANTFAEYLSVSPLAKSSVIAVDYTSGDASLAATVANKLADVYINWQREAKLAETKDATAWLSAQIDVLRQRVAEAEAAAERFRSSQGLFSGTNNTTLNAQQLSELNSQVILAKAQKSEAEARARLIKKMIADKGDIDATPEVLKSELITRLIDQRVQVQRQLAELSATLLPSHPRIKQLTSELADVRRQIRDEALKIANSLENEAEVANARESSLRGSLNDVKMQASGQSEAEIKLRALEREAKAQRDLLESYLARSRDASARHDMGSVPAQATIVSRAHASILPSFPKRDALSLLVAIATALLSLSYVLARELIGAPAEIRGPARAKPKAVPDSADAKPAVVTPSAAGFLERLRRGLAPGETPTTAPEPQGGWLGRIRPARPAAGDSNVNGDAAPSQTAGNMPVLRTNDLRHYLNQRLAASAAEAANDLPKGDKAPSKPVSHKVGPVLKPLDAVLNHILAAGKGGAPRTVLVAGAPAKLDATAEAIAIARALVARREQVVLVDLTRGPASISGALGLPRTPGLTDLVAGRAGFEDVVRIDDDSSLQVISAGNPKLSARDDENERFGHLFEALTKAYDSVVLHADREAVRQLTPALKFELPIMVAVLPAGASDSGTKTDLAEFSALGCPVLVYEQDGKKPRSRFFERVATV